MGDVGVSVVTRTRDVKMRLRTLLPMESRAMRGSKVGGAAGIPITTVSGGVCERFLQLVSSVVDGTTKTQRVKI